MMFSVAPKHNHPDQSVLLTPVPCPHHTYHTYHIDHFD